MHRSRGFTQLGVVLGYALLSAALTWPLVRDFTRYPAGDIYYDIWHAVWNVWYGKEALLGRVTWPYTSLLHFPYGVSTLVDGVGPVNAVLALPFWPWGPAAAFNGAAVVGVTLSAWAMYLLARHVGLNQPAALFAGALFTAWPIHLSALYGHLEKAFVALLPRSILAGLIAFDLRRRWTVVAPGAVLLALLFHNGKEFTFGVLALVLLGIVQVARAPSEARWRQLWRVVVVGVVSVAICAPALYVVVVSAYHPLMLVTLGDRAAYYSPDLLQFVLPSSHQALFSRVLYSEATNSVGTARGALSVLAASPGWYGSGVETAVTIPITALLLSIAACLGRTGALARRWLLFAGLFSVLAMGPYLRLAGYTYFTSSMVVIQLPYAYLQKVPGFDVMRTPGRFMMLASIGFSLAAAAALDWLLRQPRAWHSFAAASVVVLALVECWPSPWPQRRLPPVPDFYRRVAADPERYAVLDLPAAWAERAHLGAGYAYFQTVHRRPIAWAALSRAYVQYPLAGLDSLWNPARTDYAATRDRLAGLGYRYVVWHKHAELLGDMGAVGADASRDGVLSAPPVLAATSPFLRDAFQGEPPVHDDDLITVYRIQRSPPLAK